MLWLIIVLIGLIAGLYYIYRTAVLKKGVRYFVSALIMRNNHWYEKEGRKQLVSSGQRSQEAPSRLVGSLRSDSLDREIS